MFCYVFVAAAMTTCIAHAATLRQEPTQAVHRIRTLPDLEHTAIIFVFFPNARSLYIGVSIRRRRDLLRAIPLRTYAAYFACERVPSVLCVLCVLCAMADQAPAMNTWTFDDFFFIDVGTETALKKDLAKVLGVRYGSTNAQEAFATPFQARSGDVSICP